MPETVQIVIEGVDRLSGPLRSARNALGSLQGVLPGVRGSLSESGAAAQKTAAHIDGVGTASAHANKTVGMLSIGLQGMVSVAAGMMAYRVVSGLLEQVTSTFFGSVKAASDLAESQNKMNVVFGQSATVIEQFAQSSAQNFGLSKQAAMEAASTFGNLFITMGLSEAPAAEMSQSLLKLAADLASFHNIPDINVVLQKLRSGLVGEVEPLRSLGVLLTETNVKAQAMAMGMKVVGGELTQAQKVQARYALILAQTTMAQDDFARTAEGLANKQRKQTAEWENLSAKIGEIFLPLQLRAVDAQIQLGRALGGVVEKLQEYGPALEAVGDGIGRVLEAALGGPISDAASWGWEFIQQFAQGIMEGASFALQSAIAFVGDMLAYFFGPGSPPRVAPNIDQWGAAAMEEFLRGFTMADFGIFRSIGSVIESQLRSMVKLGMLPEEGLIPALIGRKTALAEAIAGIRMGAVVTEEMLDGLVAGFGRASAAVKDYLKAELALVPASEAVRAAQNNLEAVQRRLRDLRRGGADRDTLALAQAEVDMAQDALSAARDQESIQRQQVSLAKSMVDALSENQSIQAQLVSSLEKAAKGAGGVATALETLPEKAKKAAEAVKEDLKKNISEEAERIRLRIAGMFAPLEERASRLRPILQGLLGRLGINLDNVANAMGRMVGAAGTLLGSTTALRIALGLLGLVLGALTSPIGLITAALAGAAVVWTNNLGGVQERFADLQKAIAEGDWEGAFDVIKDATGDWYGWIGQQYGVILANLGEWTEAFLNWAGKMAGPLLGRLGEFLGHVLGWIMDSAPIMAREFFAKWIPAAISWVVRAAIDIIPKLAGLLLTIGNWVFEVGIPKASEFFTKMGVNIAQGLVEGIGDLAGMLGRAISNAINGLDFWVGPFHVIGGRIEVSWPQQTQQGVGRRPIYEEEPPQRFGFRLPTLNQAVSLARGSLPRLNLPTLRQAVSLIREALPKVNLPTLSQAISMVRGALPKLDLPTLRQAVALVAAPRLNSIVGENRYTPASSPVTTVSNVNITNLYVQDWADFERQLTIRGLQAKALSRSPGR